MFFNIYFKYYIIKLCVCASMFIYVCVCVCVYIYISLYNFFCIVTFMAVILILFYILL